MLGDPILGLTFEFLMIPAAAFIIGALLYQFKFRAIWCAMVGEAAIAVFFYFDFIQPRYRYAGEWLTMEHALGIPVLFLPLFAGYFFNKHFVQGE